MLFCPDLSVPTVLGFHVSMRMVCVVTKNILLCDFSDFEHVH